MRRRRMAERTSHDEIQKWEEEKGGKSTVSAGSANVRTESLPIIDDDQGPYSSSAISCKAPKI